MISSKTRSRDALLEVLPQLLAGVRRSEKGIVADTDAEFLHKYRVGLRKIRSLLTVMKDVFPIKKTTEWRKTLAGFCRATNELRDLDVYFSSRSNLENFLPETLQSGGKVLFAVLAKARRKQSLKVSAFIKSAKYRADMANLEIQWQNQVAYGRTGTATLPISRVAGLAIAKCFRRIRKLYFHLNKKTPDDTIHKVRIECKKMRYLLESFSVIFPYRNLAPMSRQLGNLQNRLGRYNDNSIQQIHLHAEAKNSSLSRDAVLALGCLIGGLHHEHGSLKKKVFEALEDFCTRHNANLAKDLAK